MCTVLNGGERGDEVNAIIPIGNHEISVKIYNGQRVVTFKDIDMVHERPEGTARKRFADNRERFIEGTDYFVVTPKILEESQKSEKRTSGIYEVNPRGTAFITESGYLMLVKSFTDDLAWDVQRKLVGSYFRVKEAVNTELSPQLQMLQGILNQMVQKELADKERDRQIAEVKETAQKAVETAERMKDELTSPFDNWRDDINKKVRKISNESQKPYQQLFTEMYSDLERNARCDLSTRQRNKRERMERSGCTKSEIQKETTKIAVIEDDARLKQIFEDIVRKYSMRYIA